MCEKLLSRLPHRPGRQIISTILCIKAYYSEIVLLLPAYSHSFFFFSLRAHHATLDLLRSATSNCHLTSLSLLTHLLAPSAPQSIIQPRLEPFEMTLLVMNNINLPPFKRTHTRPHARTVAYPHVHTRGAQTLTRTVDVIRCAFASCSECNLGLLHGSISPLSAEPVVLLLLPPFFFYVLCLTPLHHKEPRSGLIMSGPFLFTSPLNWGVHSPRKQSNAHTQMQ